MTADAILVESLFFPIDVSEEVLEGLLRTNASKVFEGLRYFDFRPAIPGPRGVRHPDGALVAPGLEEWWVVEVELHTHDVEAHIRPQLEGLGEGSYGREAFRYLDRHREFGEQDYSAADVWSPSFLLVVDHLTPQIHRAADATGFAVLEAMVYRSARSEYALALSGSRPSRSAPEPDQGIDLMLEEQYGIAVMKTFGERALPEIGTTTLQIGTRQASPRRTADGCGLALPFTVEEVQGLIGQGRRYRLTGDGRLIVVDTIIRFDPSSGTRRS